MTLTLKDILTAEVVTLQPGTSLREAAELLSAEGVSGAPVVQGGRVVGVLSATDLLDFASSNPGVPTEREEQVEWGEIEAADEDDAEESPAAFFVDLWADAGADVLERFSTTGSAEWDVLEEHTVEEAMTRVLQALPPATEVPEAARFMVDAGIHRVLVMVDDELEGIVTTTDIVRAVADRRL